MTPIVYGMPGPELVRSWERGEVELGGCCISDDLPLFRCSRCGRTSGRFGDVGDGHFDDDRWG